MRAEGLPDIVIQTFKYYYEQLFEGKTGLIPEAHIQSVDSLPDVEYFPENLATCSFVGRPSTVQYVAYYQKSILVSSTLQW